MIGHTTRPIPRRALIVDDELGPAGHGGGPRGARAGRRASRAGNRGRRSALLRGRPRDGRLRFRDPLHPPQLDPGRERQATPTPQATELLRAVRARNAKIPIFLMADREARGHGHRRGRDAGRRVRLDPRRHRVLHRGPRAWPRSSATSTACCRPSPRRWRATTASASTRGRRPATRAASPSSSRRSAACSSTSTARTCSAPTWASSAARSARCSATPARSARASAMRRACSARIAPTRC